MHLFTKHLRSSFIVLALMASFSVQAQDLHFSQYYTHASWLNPSLVGNYDGSFRLAAIYRQQWTSVTSQKYGFQTVGADVDFCMLKATSAQTSLLLV
ncbi:MAG: type IX secretion system membrane protein PorP/SprF [Bacteroidetes bacterium]|nr:type IX secretion system membrane protein PorP/SprF [Bacteroidota bacterium]